MYNILDGLRIVELSAFVAAPLGGLTLSQLGAGVVRINHPDGGLDYKRWPLSENGHSLYWHGLNKGKRSVAIDISRPEGRAGHRSQHRAGWRRNPAHEFSRTRMAGVSTGIE